MNKELLQQKALEYARNHSSAPDKEAPDWIITDYLAGAREILDNPELYGLVKKDKYDEFVDAHIGIGVDGGNHLRDYHSMLCSNCRGLLYSINFKIAPDEYERFKKMLVVKNTEEKENKELKEEIERLKFELKKAGFPFY